MRGSHGSELGRWADSGEQIPTAHERRPRSPRKQTMHNDHEVGGRDDRALVETPLTTHQRQRRIAELLATAIGRMLEDAARLGETDAHPDGFGEGLELSVPSSLDRGERGESDATRTGELPRESQLASRPESQEDA